jgi:hypothetical protein
MPIWLVKTTWKEDEHEASEQWEVNAPSAQAAMNEVSVHLRFHPLRVEISQRSPDVAATDLQSGEARRVVPGD